MPYTLVQNDTLKFFSFDSHLSRLIISLLSAKLVKQLFSKDTSFILVALLLSSLPKLSSGVSIFIVVDSTVTLTTLHHSFIFSRAPEFDQSKGVFS